MTIRSDSDGFLLGEKRLKQMAENIAETRDNTKDILAVLLGGVKNAIEAEGVKLRETITKTAVEASEDKKASEVGSAPLLNTSNKQARESDKSRQQEKPYTPSKSAEGDQSNTVASRAKKARERDEKGRFIGSGVSSNSDKSVFGKIKDILSDLKADGDTSGFDPTVDALLELKNTMTPVGNVFGRMSGRAISIFAGRAKKRRNDEVLPEEQVKANRKEEQNDKERNRLLKRMLDALLRRSRGGGLFDDTTAIGVGIPGGKGKKGRRRGRGFGRFGKMAKGIPYIGGALSAALALSDWGDQSFTEKGGTVGSLAGGAIGGGIGLLGGPVGAAVGAVIGSWAGEKLGTVVAPVIEPYFDKWTDSLIKADLPNMLKTSWDGLTNLIGKALGLTPGGIATKAASVVGNWGRNLWDSLTGERRGSMLLQQQYGGKAPNAGAAFPYNGNGDNVSQNIKQKQLAVYSAFKKAGFNDNWAAAYTASVGRENDYNDRYLYGKHNDKAGGINMGMISWQGDRQKKLYEFMKKRGLIDSQGNIIKGQASLDAQAEFKKWEIDNDPTFRGIKDYIAKNPNASKEDAARALGTKDIKWAYGQNVLRNGEKFNWKDHLEKEYNYRDSLDKAAQENSATSSQSVKVPYVDKKPTETSAVKVIGAEKRPTIKVPPITKELTKIGSSQKGIVVNQAQSDNVISQDVSNRELAHTFAGGIGYRTNIG